MSLEEVWKHCSEESRKLTAFSVHGAGIDCGSASKLYRAGLASLARGCAEFAKDALAELGRRVEDVGFIPYVPLESKKLAGSYLATWWNDASIRLPKILQARTRDTYTR